MASKTSKKESNELCELRASLGGLTQRAIAEKVGISRSLWSALENRQRPLSVALLNRMQNRLDLPDTRIEKIRLWWGESHLVIGEDKKNAA